MLPRLTLTGEYHRVAPIILFDQRRSNSSATAAFAAPSQAGRLTVICVTSQFPAAKAAAQEVR